MLALGTACMGQEFRRFALGLRRGFPLCGTNRNLINNIDGWA